MTTLRLRRAARGFSLIELMTAITIGLVILVGLASVFVNSSTTFRELRKTSEQIENGRYAIEVMAQDIRHAGFYGALWKLPALPPSSDPCAAPTDGLITDTQNNFVSLPLDVIPAPDLGTKPTVPTACAATWLTNANVVAGSDIVVVRRVDSNLATSTTAGQFYLQATAAEADLQLATATGAIGANNNARAAVSNLVRRDVTQAAAGTPPTFPQAPAYIRRYRTHIYFVAPCSVPSDGSSICTGATDDQGRPIPTLKRLELTGNTGATLFSIVPIAEGIQTMRVEYGVDDTPSTVDPGTALIGDSVPDWFTTASTARSLANLSNAVAARIYVLARNTEPTSGYVDGKTYTLGSVTTTAANDAYKRHVYSAETRITNAAGRKEIPR